MTATQRTNAENLQRTLNRNEPVRIETARWVGILLLVVTMMATISLWLSVAVSKEGRNQLRPLDERSMNSDHELLQSVSQRLIDLQVENAELRTNFNDLMSKLDVTPTALLAAREQVGTISNDNGERIKQLAVMGTAIREQLARKADAEDVRMVSSQVSGVREELKTATGDLQTSTNALGTLIARSYEEIEALRRIGNRDYFEFTIVGKNKSETIGNITITLRSTNPQKNECNLQLLVGNERTEKRNRSINEPIFFYRPSERQPAVVVINQVAKNKIVGYLSVIKGTEKAAVGQD